MSWKVRAREALSHTPGIVMCVAYYNPRVRKTAQWMRVLWHKPDDLMTWLTSQNALQKLDVVEACFCHSSNMHSIASWRQKRESCLKLTNLKYTEQQTKQICLSKVEDGTELQKVMTSVCAMTHLWPTPLLSHAHNRKYILRVYNILYPAFEDSITLAFQILKGCWHHNKEAQVG